MNNILCKVISIIGPRYELKSNILISDYISSAIFPANNFLKQHEHISNASNVMLTFLHLHSLQNTPTWIIYVVHTVFIKYSITLGLHQYQSIYTFKSPVCHMQWMSVWILTEVNLRSSAKMLTIHPGIFYKWCFLIL